MLDLDTVEYVVGIDVQLTHWAWLEIQEWAQSMGIVHKFSWGKMYFTTQEDTLAFKLKFGSICI